MARVLGCVATLLALACTTAPKAPPPGSSGVWGYVSLDPREGVHPQRAGGSYGDRRLEHTELVDYTRPGFAVVYIEAAAGREAAVSLAIRTTQVATRLDPPHAVVRAGSAVVVSNTGSAAHTVSVPSTGFVHQLAPGEAAEIPLPEPGAHTFYLLDVPGAVSTVFAAPGPHAVASDSGRFEIGDVTPGRHRLGTWHPRFPPTSRWVELESGRMLRVDIELGVEHREEARDASE